MSKSNARTIGIWTIALLPALLVLVPDAAFAAQVGQGSNIPALDGAKQNLVNFVAALAGFACIFLLGVLVWDFVQHRNVSRSIFEFLGVVLLGVIAVNAGTVAGTFSGLGAVL